MSITNWNVLLSSKRLSNHEIDLSSDYKRIITSPAFRRLQDKTQVFPLNRGDFVRTRLTHSLEVAAIAKTIATKASKEAKRLSNDDKNQWLSNLLDIQTVLECAALLHDIGNPPFGHFGETVIRSWFKDNKKHYELQERLTPQQLNDFLEFEGNAQALRIITRLHQFSGDHGMDLSCATLNTIIKYTRNSSETKDGKIVNKKVGYFYSEQDIFDSITAATGCHKNRHPLTFILEAADDIAYLTADIEDAIKKEIITYDFFKRQLDNYIEQENNAYNAIYKKLKEENRQSNYLFLTIRDSLIWCASYQFMHKYDQIMQGNYDADLFKETFGEKLHQFLKDFCIQNIFNHKSILELEIAGHTTLRFLLDKFIPAAIDFAENQGKCSDPLSQRLIGLVSESQLKVCESSITKDSDNGCYYAILMVTDFISGMTDGYATELYKKLSGIQI